MVIIERRLGEVTKASLSRFANRARKAAGLTANANILITSSDQLRELNRQFRKKDKATDVLSFPSALKGFAGDIAISVDIARENGQELGHGTAVELKVLILHGLLHLAGYDHENDNGEMERKERRLHVELGLPEGLIERNLQSAKPEKRISRKTKGPTSAKKRGQMRGTPKKRGTQTRRSAR